MSRNVQCYYCVGRPNDSPSLCWNQYSLLGRNWPFSWQLQFQVWNSDLGLSNNIYVLNDKQDATAHQQPSLNQPAANKILKSGEKISLSLKNLLETGILRFSDAFT